MKYVYMITFPNGKIYIGSDSTGDLFYFGSPTIRGALLEDLASWRTDLTIRKRVLWESDTCSDKELRAQERLVIHLHRSNDPRYGYNLRPLCRTAASPTTPP